MARGPITLEERIDALEKGLQQHGSSVSMAVERTRENSDSIKETTHRVTLQNEALVGHGLRISAIEEARRTRQLEEVRREEREIARTAETDGRLDRIEDSIKSVYSLGKWLLTTAGAVLIVAIMGFFLSGALTHAVN